MTEEEVDQYITHCEAETRLKWKRDYTEALKRGELPAQNLETPQRLASQEEPSSRPHRTNVVKIQLLPLKYKGASYSELLNFIYELENRFLVYTDDYTTNAEKVVYTASSL